MEPQNLMNSISFIVSIIAFVGVGAHFDSLSKYVERFQEHGRFRWGLVLFVYVFLCLIYATLDILMRHSLK